MITLLYEKRPRGADGEPLVHTTELLVNLGWTIDGLDEPGVYAVMTSGTLTAKLIRTGDNDTMKIWRDGPEHEGRGLRLWARFVVSPQWVHEALDGEGAFRRVLTVPPERAEDAPGARAAMRAASGAELYTLVEEAQPLASATDPASRCVVVADRERGGEDERIKALLQEIIAEVKSGDWWDGRVFGGLAFADSGCELADQPILFSYKE